MIYVFTLSEIKQKWKYIIIVLEELYVHHRPCLQGSMFDFISYGTSGAHKLQIQIA